MVIDVQVIAKEMTMEYFHGKVAVVTGAAQGIGKAIAAGLARNGAKVALCDIQFEAAAKVAEYLVEQGFHARAFKVDVSDTGSCKTLADNVLNRLGSTSILINNAGLLRRSLLDDPGFKENWDIVMRVNADGPILMVRAFLDQLRETHGNIINLASIMSIATGPGLCAYAASKGAVLQLTRTLAQDLASDGIRVNAIAPGIIETPMTETGRNNPELISRYMAHTPMGRPGNPEELVGPVLFLASDMATYVTGTLLPVDGGYLTA